MCVLDLSCLVTIQVMSVGCCHLIIISYSLTARPFSEALSTFLKSTDSVITRYKGHSVDEMQGSMCYP